MTQETYRVDEKVLAFHGPLLYEAKILEVKDEGDKVHPKSGSSGLHALIHYKGWKQSWDEWVPYTRLLKWNEMNLVVQKQLKADHIPKTASTSKSKSSGSSKDKKSGSGTGASASTSGTLSRGTKRARDDEDGSRKPEMKLEIPEQLKSILVDDWEKITKNNQLVPLGEARDPNVEKILEDFETYLVETKPDTVRDPTSLANAIVVGLRIYFDKSLGTRLLYRFERAQYSAIRAKYNLGHHVEAGSTTDMSLIYGAEHLLRMLVILPEMISYSGLDNESVALIRDYVNELFRWMVRNKERLFVEEYENSPNHYQHEMAKG